MTDFVVSDDFLFFWRNYCAFTLIAGDNNFHRFFKVTLNNIFTAQLNSTQRRFVDDISQLGTGSAAGSTGNRIEINVSTHLDVGCMYG